ncbi:Uncharacterised protein [Cedecea lapagei]|uniref:Uncharacterized protein n=1 Tax=Cedecea lapagei TaxID=158823 RepID=A0A447V411_9ENTR|nr:hypothetical protein [Cedecea lapagei]VEB98811.1 Uncharacterised protein [Cedecea lapagei]
MDTISILQVINNNFGVIGTISASVLTGLISIWVLKINNKHKIKENQQLFAHKILEQDLQEKRKIIKPVLQYFESITPPSSISFHEDEEQFNIILMSHTDRIKKHLTEFLSNYTIYMNQEINNSVWALCNMATNIEAIEHYNYDVNRSDVENEYSTSMEASKELKEIKVQIEKLKNILYHEIKIKSIDGIYKK